MSAITPTTEWRQYWAKMEMGCRQILRYIQPMDQDSFYQNRMAFDAVLRNLAKVYQAAQSLPEGVRHRLNKEDWRTITRFNEITTNAQFDHDPMELWSVIDEKIPSLLDKLRAVYKEDNHIQQHPRLQHRGRSAYKPWQLSLLGWRDIGWRVW